MIRLSTVVMVVFLLQAGCLDSDKRQASPDHSPIETLVSRAADSMFIGRLNFLDSVKAGAFDNRYGYPLHRIQETIRSMEELTGITSNADGTSIGRLSPDSSDLIRWRDWFVKYRLCLRVDSTTTGLYVDTVCLSDE